MNVKDYLASSRAPRYSLLFALPLLLLYEGLSFLLTGSTVAGVRNGADVLLKELFLSIGGRYGLSLFNAALFGIGAFLVWRDRRANRAPMSGSVFGLMFLESAGYAALLGFVVGWLTALVLRAPSMLMIGPSDLDLPTKLVTSLGAGIYEELLFRVLLTGGLLVLVRVLFGFSRPTAAAVSVVLSALIFSSFHYIGALGDRFTVASFTFRAIAGLVFSALFVTRGLGVTAWTHALYDVGLTLLQTAAHSAR